jgi:hypothetical protein
MRSFVLLPFVPPDSGPPASAPAKRGRGSKQKRASGNALSRNLAEATLATRLADLKHAAEVLAEPVRFER